MILKKVTLHGFKSFADKTEIVFNRGITAVVGPNGCGKSNVVDAIRWVLGEQSVKMLRGSKMEDVIFSGCETRKPSGLAEVTLNFDNSDGYLPIDFSEVSITRRLFRSGESQYLINKALCRLKDIHDIFMDTGIGTSSYSVIEQGQMDRIINTRPQDRREIFEEAAGITKFKTKRKEAERKLLYTEENLIRLRDILVELEGHIKKLTRQADKARRFKKLQTQLRDLDAQYTLRQFSTIQNELHDLDLKRSSLETHLHTLKNEITEAEENFQQATQNWEKINRNTQSKREQKNQIEQDINRRTQNNQYQTNRIKDLTERISEEMQNNELHQNKLQEFQKLEQEWSARKKSTRKKISENETQVITLQQGTHTVSSTIDTLNQAMQEGKNAIEQLSLNYSISQTKLIESQTQAQALVELVDKYEEEIDTLKLSLSFEDEQITREQRHLESSSEKKTSFEQIISQNSYTLVKLQEQRNSLEKEIREHAHALTEKRSRKDALQELKDSYEGFFTGVRGVMLKKKIEPSFFEGILGVVSDVISTNPIYATAVEVALGTRIQNILVQTGGDAKKAIQFLKDNKFGRVTFLPLDLVHPKPSRNLPLKTDCIEGKLLDFIEYDSRYADVLQSILGNYLIVQSLDAGITLMKQGLRGFNLVTKDGELISGSGAITGGNITTAVHGILTRSNEIESLTSEIKNLQKSLIQSDEKKESLTEETKHASERNEESKSRFQSIISEMHETEKELHKSEFQRDSYAKRLELLLCEIKKVSQEKTALFDSRDAFTDSIESSKKNKTDLQNIINETESNIEAAKKDLSEKKEALVQEKAALLSLREKNESITVRLNEINSDISDMHKWLQNISTRRSEKQGQIEQLLLGIDTEKSLLENIHTSLSQVTDSILENENQLVTLKNNMESFETIRKERQKDIDQNQESSTRIRVLNAELQGKSQNFREHLFAKYQMRIEDITLIEMDVPENEIPEMITSLENRIQNLGPINMAAIEELEALQKRASFLTKQETDLTKAGEHIRSVISQLNTIATKRFQETFEKIKVFFNEIFMGLFGGGKAELRLIEEEDFLDSGIDIYAKPPGKRPQTITLLSGGEKALTAVALLFALFKVKPSPFCLLDELDAPLDEANINRFTTLLKEFSLSTQFIVITHSKTTIKIADLLYGITQKENAISHLISVKFVSEDLDHLLEEPAKSSVPIRRKDGGVIQEDSEMAAFHLPVIEPVVLQENHPLPRSETVPSRAQNESLPRIPSTRNTVPENIAIPGEKTELVDSSP